MNGKDLRARVENISDLMDEITDYLRENDSLGASEEHYIGEIRDASGLLFYLVPLEVDTDEGA